MKTSPNGKNSKIQNLPDPEEEKVGVEKEQPQEWIVVYNDYIGLDGEIPDHLQTEPEGVSDSDDPDEDWWKEHDHKIMEIHSSKEDADRVADHQNVFDLAMHEGYGETDGGTEAYVAGPFPKGKFKIGQKYEE